MHAPQEAPFTDAPGAGGGAERLRGGDGARITAEGVETAAELSALKRLGIFIAGLLPGATRRTGRRGELLAETLAPADQFHPARG